MSLLATVPGQTAAASFKRRCIHRRPSIIGQDVIFGNRARAIPDIQVCHGSTSCKHLGASSYNYDPTHPHAHRSNTFPRTMAMSSVRYRRTYAVRRPIAPVRRDVPRLERSRIMNLEDSAHMLAEHDLVLTTNLQRSKEVETLKRNIQQLQMEKEKMLETYKAQVLDLESKRITSEASLKNLRENAEKLRLRAVAESEARRDAALKEVDGLRTKLDIEAQKRLELSKEVEKRDERISQTQAELDAARKDYRNVRKTTATEMRPALRSEVVAAYKREFDNLRHELDNAKALGVAKSQEHETQRQNLLQELARERALRMQQPAVNSKPQSIAATLSYAAHREIFSTLSRTSLKPMLYHADKMLRHVASADRAFNRRPSLHQEMNRRVPDFAERYPRLHQSLVKMRQTSKPSVEMRQLFDIIEIMKDREEEYARVAHDSRLYSLTARFEPTNTLAYNAAALYRIETTTGPRVKLGDMTREWRRLNALKRLSESTFARAHDVAKKASLRRSMIRMSRLLSIHRLIADIEEARLMQFESMAEKRAFIANIDDPQMQSLKFYHKVANNTSGESKNLMGRLIGMQRAKSSLRKKRIELAYDLNLYTKADDDVIEQRLQDVLAKRRDAYEAFLAGYTDKEGTELAGQKGESPTWDKSGAASGQMKRKRRALLAAKISSREKVMERAISIETPKPDTRHVQIRKQAGRRSPWRVAAEEGVPKFDALKAAKNRIPSWQQRSGLVRKVDLRARATLRLPVCQLINRKMSYLTRSMSTSNVHHSVVAYTDDIADGDMNASLETANRANRASNATEGEPSHEKAVITEFDSDSLQCVDTSTAISHDVTMVPPSIDTPLTYLHEPPASALPGFWNHKLYRNERGEAPAVLYCTNFEQAEDRAKSFLNASVVGFDMEWEIGVKMDKAAIKTNVSLVQIAAEDRIGLFHIALFKGETIEELMPPSLRKILESPNVAKVGVNVQGDARRLRECLNVDVQGLFELSHLYRVVQFSENQPTKVNRGLVNIAAQIEAVFGSTLKKDEVRTSSWSKRLNYAQTEYAAADAYAGLRLYHALDDLREAMRPTPPRPAYYELFRPLILGNGRMIEYKPAKKANVPTSAEQKADDPDGTTISEEFSGAVEEMCSGSTAGTSSSSSPPREPAMSRQRRAVAGFQLGEALEAVPPANLSQPAEPLATAPQLEEARVWLADWRAAQPANRKVRASDRNLEIWHMWHHQKLTLDQIASLAREPPLSLTTVASYIVTAISQEHVPFDDDRIGEPFKILPLAVHGRYRGLLARVRAV